MHRHAIRTNISIITAITMVFTLGAVNSYATNGMKVIGVGPVQRSMGGASIAVPLDSATTISNPAGMTLLEDKKRVDIGTTIFLPQVNYRATSMAGQVSNNESVMHSGLDNFIIPAVGMILPIQENFVVGLGMYGVSGMGVEYKRNLYLNVTKSKYGFIRITPAAAYEIVDNLSVGLGMNFNYAQMSFEAGTTNQVAHEEGTSLGYGFTVGVLYQVTDFLSLGAVYESKEWFPDFEFDTTRGIDKMHFDQPQSIGGGVGLKPIEGLDIAFDFVWIDWPQSNGLNKPGYTQNSSNSTNWNMNWKEQFVYKVGVQYEVNDFIALRAGYNYGKHPLDKSRPFENIAFPAIAEHHITCGTGIRVSDGMTLNLGVMYAPEIYLETANAAGQFINNAKTEMSQYSVDVGVAYEF